MKLKRRHNQNRRDFRGDFECEKCGHVEQNVFCYDDSYFHNNVIPRMGCEKCKHWSAKDGEFEPTSKPNQPDHVVM